jgi:hypothetical protein
MRVFADRSPTMQDVPRRRDRLGDEGAGDPRRRNVIGRRLHNLRSMILIGIIMQPMRFSMRLIGTKLDLQGRRKADVPSADAARATYEKMPRIRDFGLHLQQIFEDRALWGSAHSAVGQEAIAASAALDRGDAVFSHHRGHGHLIAMGRSLKRMFAELPGRSDGYCGPGGSMHMADPTRETS